MLKSFFLAIFLSLPLFAHGVDCLNSYYDLGPGAAALGFECTSDPEGNEAAHIFFCNRRVLLEKGHCTQLNYSIKCNWSATDSQWLCEDKGTYPFIAWIKKTSEETISYKFKSSFNEGEFEGRKIQP